MKRDVTTERPVVVGVFSDRRELQMAVDELRREDFSEEQIGVAAHGEQTAGGTSLEEGETASEGAASGAVTGGVIGGLAGAAAVGVIPGIGPVLAAGALAGILGGAVVGAAAGGLVGALVGMGVPEEESRHYETQFRAGNSILTVKADGRQKEVYTILRRYGAMEMEGPGAEDQSARSPGTGIIGDSDTTSDEASRFDYESDIGGVPVDQWETELPEHRRDWEGRFGAERPWSEHEAAYRFGWERAYRPEFRGMEFPRRGAGPAPRLGEPPSGPAVERRRRRRPGCMAQGDGPQGSIVLGSGGVTRGLLPHYPLFTLGGFGRLFDFQ